MARQALRELTLEIGLLGCIHGDGGALARVLADLDRRGIYRIYHLGDLLGENEECSREVLELIAARGIAGVAGHVEMEAASWCQLDGVPRGLQTIIESLPARRRLLLGGASVLLCHGSPRRVTEGLGASTTSQFLSRLGRRAGADIIVYAHTHRAYHRTVGRRLFINAGAVLDEGGGSSYAVLRLQGRTAAAESVVVTGEGS